MKISRDYQEYEYTPSSGNTRRLKLELLKVNDSNGKVYYTTIAENRNLVALCKMVDKRDYNGTLYVSREEYKMHFKVKKMFFWFMKITLNYTRFTWRS